MGCALCTRRAPPVKHLARNDESQDEAACLATPDVNYNLTVALTVLSGDRVELPLAPRSTMYDLRLAVTRTWKMPMATQQFVLDGNVIKSGDAEQVTTVLDGSLHHSCDPQTVELTVGHGCSLPTEWQAWLDRRVFNHERAFNCYAVGIAHLEDGKFFVAVSAEKDTDLKLILKESYKEKILQCRTTMQVLQGEAHKEKYMDIWEGRGLKSAMKTGKAPAWGMWLAGKNYRCSRYEPDFECNGCTFPVLFCQEHLPSALRGGGVIIGEGGVNAWGGVFIAQSGSQIVAGFYDARQGMTPGNCKDCKAAITEFVAYLKGIGY